ncbi:hypothetical protein [Consotaella aegiceratis]|uniref:hypothetical protein n=1 Tax=Consotaella aegiceratis TaxID=3097961 RepID=UPI002F42A158
MVLRQERLGGLDFGDILEQVWHSGCEEVADDALFRRPSDSFFQALSGLQPGPIPAGPQTARQDYANNGRPWAEPAPPSTDPDQIALELGPLDRLSIGELRRLRRQFAATNHPDRVGPGLRDIANRRMTIANALIDTAMSAAAEVASSS